VSISINREEVLRAKLKAEHTKYCGSAQNGKNTDNFAIITTFRKLKISFGDRNLYLG
jgi:hypothetical protein